MSKPEELEKTPRGVWRVIVASTAGTMIEWYDFYIFGSLTTIIAPLFYPPEDLQRREEDRARLNRELAAVLQAVTPMLSPTDTPK